MSDQKVTPMTPHQQYLALPVQLRQERRWARLAELQQWHNEHGTIYADASCSSVEEVEG